MNGITDALVIGIVLTLVFAAVGYYLYSRTIQLEKKVGLMETILLDLKVQTEQALEAEPPQEEEEDLSQYKQIVQSTLDNRKESRQERQGGRQASSRQASPRQASPRVERSSSRVVVKRDDYDAASITSEESQEETVAVSSAPASAPVDPVKQAEEILQKFVDARLHTEATYEAMTYRELVKLSQQMGLPGATHLRKEKIIEMIVAANKEKHQKQKQQIQGTPLDDGEEDEEDAREEVDGSFVGESE